MTRERRDTVLCAWCRRVIDWGRGGIAHGVCDSCLPAVLAELEVRLEARENVRPFPLPAAAEALLLGRRWQPLYSPASPE